MKKDGTQAYAWDHYQILRHMLHLNIIEIRLLCKSTQCRIWMLKPLQNGKTRHDSGFYKKDI
jgi:hypothetical protein